MYILVAVIGSLIAKSYIRYIILILFISFLFATKFWALKTKDVIIFYGMDFKTIIYTGVYFWAGAFLYHFNFKKYFSFETFVISFLLLIFIFQRGNLYSWLSYFLIPLVVLSFGFSSSKYLDIFNKADYSYGFYIYAFPVQQTLVYLYPKLNIYFHLTIGFIITIILAFYRKTSIKIKAKKITLFKSGLVKKMDCF